MLLAAPTSAKRQRSQMMMTQAQSTKMQMEMQLPAAKGLNKLLTNGCCRYDSNYHQHHHLLHHQHQQQHQHHHHQQQPLQQMQQTTTTSAVQHANDIINNNHNNNNNNNNNTTTTTTHINHNNHNNNNNNNNKSSIDIELAVAQQAELIAGTTTTTRTGNATTAGIQLRAKGKQITANMPTTSEQIAEAVKKLDAKLVAYLAGEEQHISAASKLAGMSVDVDSGEQDFVDNVSLVDSCASEEQNVYQQLANQLQQNGYKQAAEQNLISAEHYRRQQLELFASIHAINIQMEALTLEAEGTRRMELLQNDLRPIFTIECQLSQELLQQVPRTDSYHTMQFESEKFQSLTQCTRFGQAAERNVRLSISSTSSSSEHTEQLPDAGNAFEQFMQQRSGENDGVAHKEQLPNLGRIHFTVWWREPGTCLNEMLGIGQLQLHEFYSANLLEQCKRITIKRRNVHLANIYLKINLHVPLHKRELHQQRQHAAEQHQLQLQLQHQPLDAAIKQTGEYADDDAAVCCLFHKHNAHFFVNNNYNNMQDNKIQ